MANTYLIGYDLNKAGQNYPGLIEKIKELGAWWHCLDSTWLVKSSYTVVQIRDFLKGLIDGNDELLVINITGAHWASFGFAADCGQWLKDNI